MGKNKRTAETDPKIKKLQKPSGDDQAMEEAEPKKRKVPTEEPLDHGNSEVSPASKGWRKAASPEEDLTPEERRIFERKLKKERKKEERKLERDSGIKEADPEKPSGSQLALRYLRSWSKKAKDWRFQKTRQTWLLLHMYDAEKFPEKYFAILLRYLEGLKGGARELTVQKAKALMKEQEASEVEDHVLLEKTERARQVIQLLS